MGRGDWFGGSALWGKKSRWQTQVEGVFQGPGGAEEGASGGENTTPSPRIMRHVLNSKEREAEHSIQVGSCCVEWKSAIRD
jgi:hypothetical protein